MEGSAEEHASLRLSFHQWNSPVGSNGAADTASVSTKRYSVMFVPMIVVFKVAYRAGILVSKGWIPGRHLGLGNRESLGWVQLNSHEPKWQLRQSDEFIRCPPKTPTLQASYEDEGFNTILYIQYTAFSKPGSRSWAASLKSLTISSQRILIVFSCSWQSPSLFLPTNNLLQNDVHWCIWVLLLFWWDRVSWIPVDRQGKPQNLKHNVQSCVAGCPALP